MNAPLKISDAGKDTRSAPYSADGLIARARNPFWLAPMAGITDVCFRQLMEEMGAGVLISELVSAKGLLYNSGKTHKMMRVHAEPAAPVGIQLFGEDPDDIVEVARFVKDTGASFVDINLGCPVKKVVKKGCGAALMRDPSYLESFLYRIKKGIELPLTVKMRTGWSEEELTIHECVQAACNAGCEWVSIHGRTRAQGYRGIADWDLIREVKQKAKIPIVGNGDIRSAERARMRLKESGVDAVMIGRGALRNPWIFSECLGGEKGGAEKALKVLERYLELLRVRYDVRMTLILIRKFAAWLAFGYPGAAAFRGTMFKMPTAGLVMEQAAGFFTERAHLPPPEFEESEAFMMGGHG
ncbi:MAG: tRNA-dihydrouridine synthase family protein [Nitrospinaceae bacterium]